MGRQKYYAVRRGRVKGVYKHLQQAQKQIHGYSRCDMKMFYNRDEAWTYVRQSDDNTEDPEYCDPSLLGLNGGYEPGYSCNFDHDCWDSCNYCA